MDGLVDDNLRCLAGARALLLRLDDRQYAEPGHLSAIGPHLRHVLDHHERLLAGLDTGAVDYDARGRDPRVERQRRAALQALGEIEAGLQALRGRDPAQPLRVLVRAGPMAERAPAQAPSSLARELQFVMLHAVHHFALIALELGARGLPVDEGFGVAPATLGWRARQAG